MLPACSLCYSCASRVPNYMYSGSVTMYIYILVDYLPPKLYNW